MTITLTLNNRQVAMLHAIFGEATTFDIAKAINGEYVREHLGSDAKKADMKRYIL